MRSQAFFNRPGEYYVKYPDGGESGLMPKSAAKDYAEIFGGEVIKAKAVYRRFGLFGCFRQLIGWE